MPALYQPRALCSTLALGSFAGRGRFLDGRVSEAPQLHRNPFGESPLKKEVALISLILEQYRGIFERIYVFSPSVKIPVKKYIGASAFRAFFSLPTRR